MVVPVPCVNEQGASQMLALNVHSRSLRAILNRGGTSLPKSKFNLHRRSRLDSVVAELQQERDFTTAVLDTIGTAVVVLDDQGRILRFNQACERLTGFNCEEVRGRRIFDILIPPEEREGAGEIFKRLLLGDFPNRYENHWITKSGARRLFAWTNTAIRQQDQVRFVIGTGVDITDQRRRESELGEALEREKIARTLLAAAEGLSHTGAFEWNLEADEWIFSDEWLKIHGAQRERLTPEELIEIAHPEDRAMIRDALRKVSAGINEYDLEHRIIRQNDATVRLVQARGQFVKNHTGKVIRVYGFVQDVTESRELERKASLSEARLRSVLDYAPVGIFVSDANGKLEYLNPAGVSVWGAFRKVDMNGYGEYRGWSMETGERLKSQDWALARALKYREVIPPHRIRIETFNAQEKFISNAAAPIIGRDGEIIGGIAVTQDITDLVRAEQDLKSSTEQLRAAMDRLSITFENAGVGIIEVEGSDDRIINVNSRFAEILGYPRSELRGKTLMELTDPLDRSETEKMRELIHGLRRRRVFYDKRYLKSDGTSVWVHVTTTGIRDEVGRHKGAIATVEDIAARKRAEQALAQSEARFRELANAMPQVVWTSTRDGYIDYYNDRWYEFTGNSREDGGEESWSTVIHPDDRKYCLDQWYRAVNSREPYEIEYRWKSKAGEYRWFLGRALPVKDEAGNVLRWYGTGTDIEEYKRTQDRLNRALAALEKSQSDLKEAITLRDEFLSIASHELKTPITSLKLQAELAVRTLSQVPEGVEIPQALIDTVHAVGRQLDRLARVIEELLDVSRIQAGRLSLNFELTDVTRITREALERISIQAVKAGCSLELNLEEDVKAEVDAFRLEQVILNLVGNAIRYAPGKPIIISLQREARAFVLEVKDFGPGIPAQKQTKIFERYERASNENVAGLGLGLFITREVVRGHGGEIWVRSQPGTGATFGVRFPVRQEKNSRSASKVA